MATAEIQMEPQFETGETGFDGYRYNIQMAKDAAGIWWQRHIWHLDPYRGEQNPPSADPWIISGTGRCGPEAHYRPVDPLSHLAASIADACERTV